MGRNIYFTDRELSMVRDYVFEATDSNWAAIQEVFD